MQGVKAVAIENYCKEMNLPFVRFDYQGCGKSSGNLRELTLSDWRSDVVTVLDQLTAGPQVIVGSSMGGLLMIHAALSRPTRIKALIGVATAADLPEYPLRNLPQELVDTVLRDGECVYSTDTHEFIFTKRLLDDAPNHVIMDRDVIAVTAPVKLLHGMKDNSVPHQVSLDLAAKLKSSYVRINFRKDSDHRFSQPEDLQMIFESLNSIIEGRDQVRNLAIGSFQSFSRYSRVEDSDVIARAKANRRSMPKQEETQ